MHTDNVGTERHSVLVYGAVQSAFSNETVELLRGGKALVGGFHELKSGFKLPATAKVVVFCSKDLGQARTNLLKNAAAFVPHVKLVEAFYQPDMEKKIQEALKPVVRPPIRPEGEGGSQTSLDTSNANAPATAATTTQPSPTPPPPSNGKPELKLPPHGLKWNLTDFVFHNVNWDFRSITGEVERLFGLAKQNGYPEATESGVGQAFRKFRQANGLSQPRPRHGKPAPILALVDLGFIEIPEVADFLRGFQKVAEGTPAFVSALQKERAQNKRTIEELKAQVEKLKAQLENAKQAAELLAGLREQ